jgi:hypothetical protein
VGSGGMQQCMNCGGPVWDSETKCTTCGLHRRDVIFGEYSKWHSCSQCGELFRGSQLVCEECAETESTDVAEQSADSLSPWEDTIVAGENEVQYREVGSMQTHGSQPISGRSSKPNGCLAFLCSLVISFFICAWWVPNGGGGGIIILGVGVLLFASNRLYHHRH